MTTRLGVPQNTWVMEKDEVKELNEAWAELIESAEQAEWMVRVMNVLSLVLFILTIAMIFAPRLVVTYQVLVKQGGDANGQVPANADRRSGVDGDYQQVSDRSGESYAEISGPWS